MKSLAVTAWIVGALLVGSASVAPAQVEREPAVPTLDWSHPSLEYFLGRYGPVAGAGEGAEQRAVGGRILWPLQGRPGGWLERTWIGPYLIRAEQDDEWTESWRYGAQADLRLTRRPLAGRLDPILSLGVGALRVEESRWETPAPPRLPSAEPSRTVHSHFSLMPGLGVRLWLAPGIGVRGDARQAVDFGGGTRRNLEISAGLTVGR